MKSTIPHQNIPHLPKRAADGTRGNDIIATLAFHPRNEHKTIYILYILRCVIYRLSPKIMQELSIYRIREISVMFNVLPYLMKIHDIHSDTCVTNPPLLAAGFVGHG